MVAFAHGAGCADNGPNGETAAEGYEGLFAETPPYFVNGVFVVEVAGRELVKLSMCHRVRHSRLNHNVRIFVKRGREGCVVWTPERHGGRGMRMQVAVSRASMNAIGAISDEIESCDIALALDLQFEVIQTLKEYC